VPADPLVGSLQERLRACVRDVPDFPRSGVAFKDITPVLADARLFHDVVQALAAGGDGADVVVGIESRGFIFGAALACLLGCSFVPFRKPGKLPYHTERVSYGLEYGTDALEAHVDAIRPGQRVLIVDDVLATGGTAAAAIELVQRLGGVVLGAAFVLELGFLNGRPRLGSLPLHSLLIYD
jgi:adenine phosphoribosyltransferase